MYKMISLILAKLNKFEINLTIPYVFIGCLLASLVIEGLGLVNGRLIPQTILSVAVLLCLALSFRSKNVFLPKQVTLLLLLLVLILIFSTVFSTNKETSLIFFQNYLTAICGFFIALQYREIVKKILFPATIIISLIFSAYLIIYAIFPWFTENNSTLLSGYQLVLPYKGGHNHLGDLLSVSIFLVLYYIKIGRNYLKVLVPFFLVLIVLSASRTALLMLISTSVLILATISVKRYIKKSLLLFFIYIPILTLLLLTLSTTRFGNVDVKSPLGFRDVYFSTAISAISDKPLVGFGPGNFILASYKFAGDENAYSQTSHNIFLDFFSETGIAGGLLFTLIMVLAIKKSNRGIAFYIMFSLIINFQIDYLYRITSLLVLFFVFVGLSYDEAAKLKLRRIYLYLTFTFIFIVTALVSLLYFLPLPYLEPTQKPYTLRSQESIYKLAADDKILEAKKYLNLNRLLAENDPNTSFFLARTNLFIGERKEALHYLQLTHYNAPYKDVSVGKTIYELLLDLEDELKANDFAKTYFGNFPIQKLENNDKLALEIIKFCQIVYKYNCPYDFTTEMHLK